MIDQIIQFAFRTALTAVLLAGGFAETLRAQAVSGEETTIEVQTLNGLKNRRLFDLAIAYGTPLLESTELESRTRVDVAVELIDVVTQKAWQSRDAGSWEQARQFATRMSGQVDSPRSVLISIQTALIDQTQIEQAIRELESDSATGETRENAMGLTTNIVARFDDLQNQISMLMNRRPRPGEESQSFSSDELLALRYNLEYQQARVLLHRGSLFADDDELNRNDVLTLAEEQFNQVLRSVDANDALWWAVQTDRIAVARATRNFSVAESIVSRLPENAFDESLRQRLAAEWVRTLVAQRRFDQAIAVTGRGSLASESPQMDLARIELFVKMDARESGDEWQRRALDLTSNIEQAHGGYWARLANLSVVGTANSVSGNGSSLDLLIRVADEAQRKQQWEDAVKALDAAFASARDSKQDSIAWKLGFRAASILQKQANHLEAAGRFENLATELQALPDAHSASLMACWNFSKVVGDDEERFGQYEEMLQTLVDTWSQSSSADQARIWLASIRTRQKNWPSAISLLLNINSMSPLFGRAVEQLRSVVGSWSLMADVAPESRRKIHAAIASRLLPLLDADAASMPDNWAMTRQQIVLQLATLQWLHGTDISDDPDVSRALQQELDNLIVTPSIDENVLETARALRFVAAATDPRSPAEQGLQPPVKPDPTQLRIILTGLMSDQSDPDQLRKSQFLREAFKRYSTEIDSLPDADNKAWKVAILDALVASGRENMPAIVFAEQLATAWPGDAEIQIRLAELLTAQAESDPSTAEHATRALNQWRRIAKRSKRDTESWFIAKYHVTKLLAFQGKEEDALKLLSFVKAVPPGWSKAPNAPEFDELYRSLGGK